MHKFGLLCATVSVSAFLSRVGAALIPEEFPKFLVPGSQETADRIRELFYLHYMHYRRRSKPMPTLWDVWLSGSTLWPAFEPPESRESIRTHWAKGLSSRYIDAEGYVSSHQHASIAHQHGWPFPFWQQGGPGTWGWHFSLRGVPHNWDGSPPKTEKGWTWQRARNLGVSGGTWNLELTAPRASVTTPPLEILADQSPFIQLRWRAEGLQGAQPHIEWTTERNSRFGAERRFYFEPLESGKDLVYTMIPLYKSPRWKGKITRLRIAFDNPRPGAKVSIQSIFTQYDTRHNVNNASFIRGCCQYFNWTRDLNFLRRNLQRMRLAMRYMQEVLGGRREKCIVAPFPGHDGRSGIELLADGGKIIHSGRGISNNYWDILPMGYRDAYATIQYYDALKQLALLEEEIRAHPEWNMLGGPLAFDPEGLRKHAEEVKKHAGKLFWNEATGRFVAGMDIDGIPHDYGFTFLNCEAVCCGFATEAQAQSIMEWLCGDRLVRGDTSQGPDIYHWRFGPRSTTRRNIDWYGWYWYAPESLPWGGQVQDGGAVLGFSYFDLMARLKTRGPENAWTRLKEIADWFGEVQEAGGYRKYYRDPSRGTLQGGGVCGGLGVDEEFYESILVPQIMLRGFMGFRPRGDGFEIQPRLPERWPSLRITRIHFHRLVLDIEADRKSITISAKGASLEPERIYLPQGLWLRRLLDPEGKVREKKTFLVTEEGCGIPVRFDGETTVRLLKIK